MANYLWKVTANRNAGRIKKGMSAEVRTKGSKPVLREITEALNAKYNENFQHSEADSTGAFDISAMD